MNNEPWALMSLAGFAISAAVATWLLGRCAQTMMTIPSLAEAFPWHMRLLWRPAGAIAQPIGTVLGVKQRDKSSRFLAAHDLDASFSPEHWLALRVSQALTLSMLVGATTWALKGPLVVASVVAFAIGYGWLGIWCRQLRLVRDQLIARDLPAYLDLLTVCVESGATLTAGIRLVVDQAPQSPLRHYFQRVLREVRAGRPRAQAFETMARLYAVQSLSALAAALVHAEKSGMSLGTVLRAQAEQRIAERFARAEKLAMQASVKLLGPLILCIFPCTFIVLAVPIVVRLAEAFHS
jgi:tight adherence protein C